MLQLAQMISITISIYLKKSFSTITFCVIAPLVLMLKCLIWCKGQQTRSQRYFIGARSFTHVLLVIFQLVIVLKLDAFVSPELMIVYLIAWIFSPLLALSSLVAWTLLFLRLFFPNSVKFSKKLSLLFYFWVFGSFGVLPALAITILSELSLYSKDYYNYTKRLELALVILLVFMFVLTALHYFSRKSLK